ncbi:putative phosphatase regulatory subunit-domain-containing protein [Mycena polygramma]|nr:putative phosphatase regulatory subunit-domain-containing protein [Mycena polygramma]
MPYSTPTTTISTLLWPPGQALPNGNGILSQLRASRPQFYFYHDDSGSETDDGPRCGAPDADRLPHCDSASRLRPRSTSSPIVPLPDDYDKPLKSSIKPRQRTRSAPNVDCKEVHFPSADKGLERVAVFKRRARVTSVSLPLDDQTEETDTETDTDAMPRWAGGLFARTRTTWTPRKSPLTPPPRPQSPPPQCLGGKWGYKLVTHDAPRSPDAGSMVLLETMHLVGAGANPPSSLSPWTPHEIQDSTIDGDAPLALGGTLLARNVAFEKHIAVRFTLDTWRTTSEVHAHYLGPREASSRAEPGPGWDRFAFSIPLAHYGGLDWLAERELILAVHFSVPWVGAGDVAPYTCCGPGEWSVTGASGAGEWWDNNSGRDYRVGFQWVYVPPPAREECDTPPLTNDIDLDAEEEDEEEPESPPPSIFLDVPARESESPSPLDLDAIPEAGERADDVLAPSTPAEEAAVAAPLPYHAFMMHWCVSGATESMSPMATMPPLRSRRQTV